MEKWNRAISSIALACAAILGLVACPSMSEPERPAPTRAEILAEAPQESEKTLRAALEQDIAAMLGGGRTAGDFAYLTEWPLEDLHRLHTWLTLGIQIEGVWESHELSELISLLDAFGATCGEARFAALLQTAVASRSAGKKQHLRIVREACKTPPAAAWYAKSGRIVLNDGLWDPHYMFEHHSWSFLSGDYAQPGPDITTRQVVISHELGHVIIEGMRAEAASTDYGVISIEGLYSAAVPCNQWPHFDAPTNEHLATEIAVWALGITRTTEINDFRASVLSATATGPDWPQALTRTPTAAGR